MSELKNVKEKYERMNQKLKEDIEIEKKQAE